MIKTGGLSTYSKSKSRTMNRSAPSFVSGSSGAEVLELIVEATSDPSPFLPISSGQTDLLRFTASFPKEHRLNESVKMKVMEHLYVSV